MAGLPGIIFSLSDLGMGKLVLLGPTGLRGVYETMSPFVNRRYPEVEVIEIDFDRRGSRTVSFDHFKIELLGVKVAQL